MIIVILLDMSGKNIRVFAAKTESRFRLLDSVSQNGSRGIAGPQKHVHFYLRHTAGKT
ncbi:MAG: hypothetical protein LBK08_05390 [Treponema sp.]|jgi:hypothetical protein|nr:hypothetical protein [Treponema sp.]